MARPSPDSIPGLISPLFTAEELAEVVRALGLSPRQGQIIEHLLQAHRDKQIAQTLHLKIRTVREHLSRIFLRTGAADRMELVLLIVATVRRQEGEKCCHHL